MSDAPIVPPSVSTDLQVGTDKFSLQNADKRHKREAAVMELQITKYYEDKDAQRAHQKSLTMWALVAVFVAFAACLFAGKAELAEKILTGVLPVGAYALGSGKKSPEPKAPKASDDE